MSDTRKLVLIDAYSLLFRAFFSSRALSTSDGRPTGALYGLSNMLFTLIRNEKPDSIIVCWDAHQRTHRKEAFEDYKAHRPDTAPDLKAQMFPARDLVAAFGVQSAELGGYEADDLIGTLARRGRAEGYEVEIITGDSDQLQLVGEGVTVQITQRGVTEVKRYDRETVIERYGVPPERIPDWKGLVGDTSDNIPGVPGIGEKTATLLLQKFGTIDGVLEHLDEVTPPKAKAALEANRDGAKFSRELATIVCDAPFSDEIRPYSPTPEVWNRLREAFTDLEFKSLLRYIPQERGLEEDPLVMDLEANSPSEAFAAKILTLDTDAEVAAALEEVKKAGRLALVLEADSPAPLKAVLRGIGFACSPETCYYVPLSTLQIEKDGGDFGGLFDTQTHPPTHDPKLRLFAEVLKSPDIQRYAHNGKPIQIVLERQGMEVGGFAFDSQIAAYLLDANKASYPLSELCETYLKVRLEAEDPFSPEAIAAQSSLVLALEPLLTAELDALGMTEVFRRVEMPLIPALSLIERTGLSVDAAYLNTLAARMTTEADAIAAQVYEIAGEEFNIGSPKQLQVILFDKMQLPTGKKTKTGYSTGADLLEQLAPKYDIARLIIEYREVTKLKNTYAEALPKLVNPATGRLHTSLNQTVASTGRLSSSDPNLQNIPIRSAAGREIRRAFVAPKGYRLLSCDYSQIELRILAHVTGDPALTEAFLNDRDVHAATASRVFDVPLEKVTSDQRRQAKTINFAVIYGQSGFALANTLGVETKVASQWIKEYFEQLPGVKQYVEETMESAKEKKYVQTLLGRRRYVPELDSPNFQMRQFGERAAVNMPIQGTAADIMKLAMIDVYEDLISESPDEVRLLLQVHDELLFEVSEAHLERISAKIRGILEAAFTMNVPLRADAKSGANWAEMDGSASA